MMSKCLAGIFLICASSANAMYLPTNLAAVNPQDPNVLLGIARMSTLFPKLSIDKEISVEEVCQLMAEMLKNGVDPSRTTPEGCTARMIATANLVVNFGKNGQESSQKCFDFVTSYEAVWLIAQEKKRQENKEERRKIKDAYRQAEQEERQLMLKQQAEILDFLQTQNKK